jgi:hypothetical protein
MAERRPPQLINRPPATSGSASPHQHEGIEHFLGVLMGLEEQQGGDTSDAAAAGLGVLGVGKLGQALKKVLRLRTPPRVNMSPEFKPSPGAWDPPAEFLPVDAPMQGPGRALTLDDITAARGEAAYQRVRAAGGKPTPQPHPANPSNPGDKVLREHELPGKSRPVPKPVKRKDPK